MLSLSLALAILVPVVSAAGEPPATRPGKTTRNVAIVVHEGVELLDFAGPGEVFEVAAWRGAEQGRPWFNMYTVAPSAGPVLSQLFLTVEPEYTIDDCPPPDILVIPGGATSVLTGDERFMGWVRQVAPDAEILFSVCTGAFVLAEAGLLDGCEATTHHSAVVGLQKAAPGAVVHEDRRFVDNGRVITAAGVSAGIDGALHVVARLLGRYTAERTARYMEYRWQPEPRAAANYAYLNPQLDEHDRARQQADIYREQDKWSRAVGLYRELVEQDQQDAAAWYGLGLTLHEMGNFAEAAPAHQRAAELGRYPLRTYYNLACAYAMLGEKPRALDALGKAVVAGFANRQWIEQDAQLNGIRDEPRFRAIVERIASPRAD
ncbi:MAG: DJ-1/PfpI family protein [Planctomycetota bacterium]|jgi:transcriptional regulator GlxA family with amidase domain